MATHIRSSATHVGDIVYALLEDHPISKLTQGQHEQLTAFHQRARSVRQELDAKLSATSRDPNLSALGRHSRKQDILREYLPVAADLRAKQQVVAKEAADLRGVIEAGRLEPADGGGYRTRFDLVKDAGGELPATMKASEIRAVARGMGDLERRDWYLGSLARNDAVGEAVARALEDGAAVSPVPLLTRQDLEHGRKMRFDTSPHRDRVQTLELMADSMAGFVGDLDGLLGEARSRAEIDAVISGVI